MRPIRILIADDSVIYRSQVKAALSENSLFEVVGVASNGRLALERLSQVHVDLLILDLEMPEMDGLQTLRNLKLSNSKCKVIVFTSTSRQGTEVALEALKLGAIDFVPKPGAQNLSVEPVIEPSQKIRALLEPKILALFHDPITEHQKNPSAEVLSASKVYSRPIWEIFTPKIVVIGASTGGPTVLEKVFSQIGPPLTCPILIVQHMPPVFTATFASRLQSVSGISVTEAVHGTTLNQNSVYMAPGNFHMSLSTSEGGIKINLDQGPQRNSVRPAVDPLFESAASIFKSGCLGIVFTGMGADGMVGAERIKESGGVVIIQEQNSCVVFGMPGAVKSVNAYDFEFSPDQIVSTLIDKVARPNINLSKDASGAVR